MKKFFFMLAVSSILTSCTYEDVINYLNGNLTNEEKEQVNKEQLNQSFINEIDPDKIKPPTHG
ncbi:hypothetical protein BWK59_12760 [Flavobacterium davisii]|uniref:Lipoprotein n=2 Tax=Flavobacterium davisii TaxID=2906077 RepID=A0A246GFW0_9FLAO|nr:hypothetical protein BWK59_12760 [Flavobacterium davisii]